MQVDPNWFLFVEDKEIRWSFGNPDDEFREFVINFLTGLSQIGEEIFGENGVASIDFDMKKKSRTHSSEIFMVNLSNRFFIIMSDPSTTMKLIKQQGGLAKEVQEIMSAVLVGQAAILYAECISEVPPEESEILEIIWQDIIVDISEEYSKDISTIVSANSSNFSMLSFEDLLFLHYSVRKQPELIKQISPKGWALVSHYSGGEIPLEHNMEWDSVVLAGYLGIIISFITVLFDSKPKQLHFGTNTVQCLSFINGKKDYFIAIDSPFTKMILDPEFQSKFYRLEKKIMNDLEFTLRERIIEEILTANSKELEKQDLNKLIKEHVLSRKSLFNRLFSKRKRGPYFS